MRSARPIEYEVTNAHIEQFLKIRRDCQKLRMLLSVAERALNAQEAQILTALDNQADLSRCSHKLSVMISEQKRPSWKREYVFRLGEEAAARVFDRTLPSLTKKLIVEE